MDGTEEGAGKSQSCMNLPAYSDVGRTKNTKKEVRMKMSKIEESNSIDLRFIEANDEKSGKEALMEPLRSKRVEDKAEKFLDDMLKFLAEMPIDRYHDYRAFRNIRLRDYLINRFLRERIYLVQEGETSKRA
jgi:hypothetical protein